MGQRDYRERDAADLNRSLHPRHSRLDGIARPEVAPLRVLPLRQRGNELRMICKIFGGHV
jgi:transcriptional regulator with GAF, ATPase, and Fis domain